MVARNAIREIGYEQDNFHWLRGGRRHASSTTSQPISRRASTCLGNKDEGAGDQGMMFGFACNDTPALMPAPIYYSHDILRALSEARHAGKTPLLGPDSKSQVTLRYVNRRPVCATKVVVSIQHADAVDYRATCASRSCGSFVLGALPDGLDVRRGAFSSSTRRAGL